MVPPESISISSVLMAPTMVALCQLKRSKVRQMTQQSLLLPLLLRTLKKKFTIETSFPVTARCVIFAKVHSRNNSANKHSGQPYANIP